MTKTIKSKKSNRSAPKTEDKIAVRSADNTTDFSTDHSPERPKNSFRIVLDLSSKQKRLDTVLLQALRDQDDNFDLKHITRSAFKKLFDNKRIQIKGQNARTSSAVAKGLTYVDILGY